MVWKPELEELARRESFAREMGGPDKVKRQRDSGRLTVRERIAILEDLQSHAEQNRHFYLYLFKEGFEPKYEVKSLYHKK